MLSPESKGRLLSIHNAGREEVLPQARAPCTQGFSCSCSRLLLLQPATQSALWVSPLDKTVAYKWSDNIIGQFSTCQGFCPVQTLPDPKLPLVKGSVSADLQGCGEEEMREYIRSAWHIAGAGKCSTLHFEYLHGTASPCPVGPC